MKYDHRDVTELGDLELVQAYQNCRSAEKKRETASKHHKFDKVKNPNAIEFPPINPEFLKLKDEVHNEMLKRGLEVEQ